MLVHQHGRNRSGPGASSPCRLRVVLPLMLLTLFVYGSARADCNLTEIKLVSSGVSLRWNTRSGFTYQVLSADNLDGPWTARDDVKAAGSSATWTDPQAAVSGGRFYRIKSATAEGCDPETGLDSATAAALFEADSAPRVLLTTFENSRQLTVEAVYLASRLSAGGLQLITTGTLTQQGQSWSYSATPADHLVVQFQGQAAADIFVTTIQGDFSADEATFLNNSHILEWRGKAQGLGDFTFSSHRSGRLIESKAKGTMPWKSGDLQVDVTSNVDHYFESSSGGSQTITDNLLTGTMTGPGFQLKINQRFRFEIIVQDGASASTNQEWIGSELLFEGTSYRWADVKKQKSFRDGKPSSVDEYWNASGQLLRNNATFGQYRKTYDSVGGAVQIVKFVVQFPDRIVEVESWNIL